VLHKYIVCISLSLSLFLSLSLSIRWQRLLSDSDGRKQRLLRLQDQYRQVEDLYLTFAKKASAFNSWFENAEEDLTDPVRCNSVEEIKVCRDQKLEQRIELSIIAYIHNVFSETNYCTRLGICYSMSIENG